MPIYEYECPKCGRRVEILFISTVEPPSPICSNCTPPMAGDHEYVVMVKVPSLPSYSKLEGGFCARTWNGKQGAATSRGPNDA